MTENAPNQAPRNARYFKEPALVLGHDALRHQWGGAESHFVADLAYGRGDRLAGLVHKLAPAKTFGTGAEHW